MLEARSFRWLAVSVFVVSSTLNYLDRQLLAFWEPAISATFGISLTQFGLLISAFSSAYAASSLLAGYLLDRVGVNRGIRIAVGWWSAASIASAFAPGIQFMACCRAALGIGESAGVPAVGKLNGVYLKPEERALGAAVNQIGLSLGAILAPLSIGIGTHSWRIPFLISGLLGVLWIPMWSYTSKKIPPAFSDEEFAENRSSGWAMLGDRRLQILVVANLLWMGSYSIWSNWTTIYLVNAEHLTLQQAAHYAWVPPLLSNFGGFFGGWLSLHWMRRGHAALDGRRRAVWVAAAGSLLTFALPFAQNVSIATVVLSVSFFFAVAGSVNIYALPIDLYGASRAGFAISALTFAFGVLQTVISPLIGLLADHHLYTQVTWFCTLPLLASSALLQTISRTPSKAVDKL